MQAVVLVGGEGTRLRPLTFETPKPMVPIMNVPFLERTLRRLKDAGIDDVILPAGYLPEAITSYFGDGTRLGLKIRYVIEETPLGTAGALKNIERFITGPFFVLNGDILTSLDLRAMRAYHEQKRGLATLHLIKVEDPSAFGSVRARRKRPHHARSSRSPSAKKPRPTRSTPAPTCSKPTSWPPSQPAGRSRSSAKRFRSSSPQASRSTPTPPATTGST